MSRKFKVLNLYAGLGGNRKLWGGCEVTAVEYDPTVAKFYKDHFPDDEVIIADAHDYLLKNYRKYDFIWSSINCPTHSRARFWNAKGNESVEAKYPDFKLYEEITFLMHYFDGQWVVENVKPFYEPLINPTIEIGRHLFWCNFDIMTYKSTDADCTGGKVEEWQDLHGFDISSYAFDQRRDKILRNCVQPELGKHILDCAIDFNAVKIANQTEQMDLF